MAIYFTLCQIHVPLPDTYKSQLTGTTYITFTLPQMEHVSLNWIPVVI